MKKESSKSKLCEALISSLLDDEFIEIRKLPDGLHGAFNDRNAILEILRDEGQTGNLYFGLNPRKLSNLKSTQEINPTSLQTGGAYKTEDVSRVAAILIDFDRRKKETNKKNVANPSTDEELQEIRAQAKRCSNYLLNKGVPHLFCLSGNGYHLLIKVDYEASMSTVGSIKELFLNMDIMFGTESVSVDCGNHDLPRICKFYGTIARKGRNSSERPYRQSKIISGEFKTTDIFAKLNLELIDLNSSNFRNPPSVDIVKVFKERDLYRRYLKPGVHIVDCPFSEDHSTDSDGTSTTTIFDGTDKWGFKCFHASCNDRKAPQALEKLGVKISQETSNAEITESLRPDNFNLRKLGDFLNEPDPQHEWLVKDVLIIGGTSLIVGKPKAGKTTLIKDLAYAVASGSPWLGYETLKGKVIYLALEEKDSQLRESFRKFGTEANESLFLHTGIAPLNAPEKLFEVVNAKEPVLVIIDTLFKFSKIEDENAYGEAVKKLESISAVARKLNSHIMLSHHQRKGASSNSGDTILGSQGFFGAVDTSIFIEKDDNNRTIHSTQRYGVDIEEKYLVVDHLSGRMSAIGKTEFDFVKVENSVTKILLNNSEGLEEKEILELVGVRKSDAQRELRKLVTDGKIIKEGDGKKGAPYVYKLFASPKNVNQE